MGALGLYRGGAVFCRFTVIAGIHREGLTPSSLPPLYDTDRDDNNYSDTQPHARLPRTAQH